MDWTAIPRSEWISLAALLIACASASFTWRNLRISARKERREIAATRPIVEYYVDFHEDFPRDFLSTRIVIRNRAAHGLVVDTLASSDPGAALILDNSRFQPLMVLNAAAYDAMMRDCCSATIGYGSYIAPEEDITLGVNIQILKPRETVQISLSLSERLPEIRRSAITVKIKLPAETIKAVTERSKLRPSEVASSSVRS